MKGGPRRKARAASGHRGVNAGGCAIFPLFFRRLLGKVFHPSDGMLGAFAGVSLRLPLRAYGRAHIFPLRAYGTAYAPLRASTGMARETGDLLQGTLGLLILKALVVEEQHGYGIARWISATTHDVLEIPEGSLYPALRRLEDRELITSRWDLSENNRRARFYALTPSGRKHLQRDAATWMNFAKAVVQVLRAEPAILQEAL